MKKAIHGILMESSNFHRRYHEPTEKMSVLAQISSWIPDRIADDFTKRYGFQTRSFGPFSHVTAMMCAQLAHSLSLNDLCDDLHNHAGTLEQRGCTSPSHNALSCANRTRNAIWLRISSGPLMRFGESASRSF